MTLQKLAGKRLLEGGAAVITALLLAGPAVASPDQSRQPHGGGGDSGRTAVPHSMGSAPSAPSGPSARSADGGGGGGGGGRTAEPAPGGGGGGGGNHPSRQPPHNPGGGHDHGHGGYGGYYGGYYYPYYSPYWWGWGAWWGYPYYGYGYGPAPYYPDGGGYYNGEPLGALDLDVSPGRAQVYLDGRYIGTVDAFDGFPRYLWLPKGTYDLAFFLDGFKTVSRQVSVYPGTVIDFDDHMEPGASVRPEDLVTKSHDRRDTRIREENQQREEVQGEEGDWQDRVREERQRQHEGGQWQIEERGHDEAGEAEGDRDDGRGNETRHGQLHIDVDPEDASIYLDGRFVGTGEQLDHGLSVNPGKHQISVVRPGHESKQLEIEVEPGQQVEVDIELGSTS